jgi:hypothetical protein
MKIILPLLILTTLMFSSCDSRKNNGGHSHDEHTGGNQALYDEVMNVHDEVMPKMDDIYKLKEQLKRQITDAPNMVQEKRKAIETAILRLDSASDGMMVWMRNFNPLPDSLGEEQARQYLEDEKKKVTRVKEDMLEAIDEAKSLQR